MKTQTVFQNSSLVSVVNGSIVVKDSTGREHTFTNASVVSVNNGTIIIESEWKPKRGELVKILNGYADSYSIFDDLDKRNERINIFGYKRLDTNGYYLDVEWWAYASVIEISPVTPEEQKEFDDFCKSKGKIWNKEKLQWEKYKWHPKLNDTYYYIDLEIKDGVGRHIYENDYTDRLNYECGNCFLTEKQAAEAAEKVKELLKSL